jgi:hypothetical protein
MGTDRMAVVRKLVLVHDLIGFDKILKPANTLLEEAIRAYATGSASLSVFLPEDQNDRAVDSFRGIIAGNAGIDAMISKIVRAEEFLKQTALDQWIRSRAEVHMAFDPKLVEAGHPQRKDIRWWLKSEELAYVEGLIRPLGIDLEIQRRGLQGLLELKPVRAWVNALAAYVFDITVGKERQPRAPRWGDSYDMWQIISASTADNFVTYDGKLLDLLNRLPVSGFRIFSSIAALNDAIAR